MTLRYLFATVLILLHGCLATAQTYEDKYYNTKRQSLNNVSKQPDKAYNLRKGGIITAAAGTGLIILGAVKNATDPPPGGFVTVSNGDVASFFGVALVITGGSLLLAGIFPHQHHRVTLVVPRRSRIGLAYNF